ncbi:MAG: YmdB family metallophosphoesterase, partial [Ignavibacteriae bacterium]|nr:YmdB family metallophosphoesterase [Ignavibacteriota bacterium]
MARTLSVLFIGDIVGNPGMNAVRTFLPSFIQKYSAQCVIINGENIVNGKGLTEKEATELFALGANVITTGNHVWENWQSRPLLASNPLVLRPLNYPAWNSRACRSSRRHWSGGDSRPRRGLRLKSRC